MFKKNKKQTETIKEPKEKKVHTVKVGTHKKTVIALWVVLIASVSFAYYVSGNVIEPIGRDYLYSELVNPIFTKDGDNVKVKVAVKFLDNQTKATQVSQYELVLHKDSNWKIVG